MAFLIHEILLRLRWLPIHEEIVHLLDPIGYLSVERVRQFLVDVALHQLAPIFILLL